MARIPVAGPSITQREIDYVTDAVTNAWYADANKYHAKFEAAFAGYLGVPHAMALPSCTSAIHLALMALGVGPGDEVIVPDVTWIASAAPVTYVGATPVFADIEADTWCMSADSFRECVTPRTKAIIPVDLYGGMPDMDEISRIAAAREIPVIEDAAEAVGSEWRGKRAGSLGTLGVFSFHGSKTLTTGEGGLLVTRDEKLFARAQVLRDHGRRPGDRLFFNTEVAHKYKMSSMQAALGLAQLERIDELVEMKRRIFGWYREELASVEGVRLNAEPPGTKNSYWMVTMVVDPALGVTTAQLMERLDKKDVDTRPFFHPLSALPAYAAHPQATAARARNKVGYAVSDHGVNLPSALNLARDQVSRVCDAVRGAVR
jgi:perosamine synthetase